MKTKNQIERKLRADLEAARTDLGTVRQRLGELIEKESLLEWQVTYISRVLGESSNGHPMPFDTEEAPRERMAFSAMSAPQITEMILRETGKPMRMVEIVQQAILRGYGGPNAEPRKIFANFSSFLSRAVKKHDSIFVKTGRGIFGLNLPSSHHG